MSRNVGKDFSPSPETVQLLASHLRDDVPKVHVRPQLDEPYLECDVSSSRQASQDRSTGLSHNPQISETSSNPVALLTLPSVAVNGNANNDDPPPYSAIAPLNHVIYRPYGLFSFDNTYPTDGTSCRVEIPLTPFQASLTPAMGFHSEENNGQHASFPMPLTPYRFFKFGCRRSSLLRRETSLSDNGIAEKIDDRKSRRYGAILVAAAVIIFLMVLSLMVRFVMERSWWRK